MTDQIVDLEDSEAEEIVGHDGDDRLAEIDQELHEVRSERSRLAD